MAKITFISQSSGQKHMASLSYTFHVFNTDLWNTTFVTQK